MTRDPAIDAVISLVAYRGQASVRALMSARHGQWVRPIRMATMLLIRSQTGASDAVIGAHLGGRSLSHVSVGLREARRLMSCDADFRGLVDAVRADLCGSPA